MKNINLKIIRIDGGTQSRVALHDDTVTDYADVIREGGKLPPVIVFFDGSDHWLADGFHRLHAYRTAGKASIPADVQEGTRNDAALYASGANGTHGLRRTNADKRRSVEMTLANPLAAGWSDRQIADHCCVTHPFVASIRAPKVVTVTTPLPQKEAAKTPIQPSRNGANGLTGDGEGLATPPIRSTTSATPTSDTKSPPVGESLPDGLQAGDMPTLEEIVDQQTKEIEQLQAQIKALTTDDTKAELARQISIRQGIESRLSDEMEKNKALDRTNATFGKWYAELRKLTGLDERSAITRFVREAKQSRETAL